jgi:osmotically-inducible protein OsmY
MIERSMLKSILKAVLVAAGALALASCQQRPATETVAAAMPVSIVQQAPEHDIALLIKVKNAQMSDPDLKTLEVGVQGGVVTLYGKVATPEQRMKAERIARNIRGVATVKSGIAVASAT